MMLYPPMSEPLDTKPVSMAIDEVYDGRLQVVHKE